MPVKQKPCRETPYMTDVRYTGVFTRTVGVCPPHYVCAVQVFQVEVLGDGDREVQADEERKEAQELLQVARSEAHTAAVCARAQDARAPDEKAQLQAGLSEVELSSCSCSIHVAST